MTISHTVGDSVNSETLLSVPYTDQSAEYSYTGSIPGITLSVAAMGAVQSVRLFAAGTYTTAGSYPISLTLGTETVEDTVVVVAETGTAVLNYSASGGSGAPSSQSATGNKGETHTFRVSDSAPYKDGSIFTGWSESSGASSATYGGGSSISVPYGSSVTLYAVWAKDNDTIYVTSISISAETEMTVGDTQKVSATCYPDNANMGKEYSWSVSDSAVLSISVDNKLTAVGAGTASLIAKAKDGSGVTASVEITVKAKTCKVVLDSGEGDAILDSDENLLAGGEGNKNTTYELESTVGATFDVSAYRAGWVKDSSRVLILTSWTIEGNTVKSVGWDGSPITLEGDTTLTAAYSKDGTITIYLDAKGGSAPDSITVTSGETVTLPVATKAAEVDGTDIITYTYVGWTYNEKTYTDVSYNTDYAGQTFVAKYDKNKITRKSSSTVSLDDAGYPESGIASDAFTLSMSDNTGRNLYRLMGTVTVKGKDGGSDKSYYYNCITSLSVTGGPEDPFEHLQIVIPKRRLRYVAPALAEDDGIIAGITRIQLGCMGRGMFTVSKVRYSGRRLTITAYCDAERFRGCTAGTGGYSGTPRSIINQIIKDRGRYGALFGRTSIEDENDHKGHESQELLTFDEDANIWYILQVCAMLMRCRIWFADDTMYVRDCTVSYVNGKRKTEAETVDLYPNETTDAMWGRVLDDVQLGDEGSDTITNSVTVRCLLGTVKDNGTESGGNEDEGEDTDSENEGSDPSGYSDDAEFSVTMGVAGPFYEGGGKRDDSKSIRLFGEHEATLSIPELRRGVFSNATGGGSAKTFAVNYIEYLREPSQSVEFTLKEIQPDGTWLPYFDEPSMAALIKDDADEIRLTNRSVEDEGEVMPQKLMLSSHERHWPNCTTTYVFGQMQSISLSDSTSRITSALYKGRWPDRWRWISWACASAG